MADEKDKGSSAPGINSAPLWIQNGPRYDSVGAKMCQLRDCTRSFYAKGLCNLHYQAFRRGLLDPLTGKMATKENEEDFHEAFGKPQDWVFLRSSGQLVHKISGERMSIYLAETAFGKATLRLIRTGEVPQFRGECFHPTRTKPDHYNSFKILDSMKCTLGDGETEPLHPLLETLLRNLGGDNFEYLVQWLAYGIQNPGEPSVVLVLYGVPGSGKSTLGSLLHEIYGPYHETVGVHALESEFNGWIEKKLIITAEEISFDGFLNKGRMKDVLKNYVIGGTVNVNRKGLAQYTLENLSRWMFFSNSKKPVPIDIDDRRYSVINQSTPLDTYVGNEINNQIGTMARNLVNYLHRVDLSDFAPMFPLQNKARQDVIDANKTGVLLMDFSKPTKPA